MNTQTNSPTDSSTCQMRARSRYSKPCSPNQFEAAPSSTPWMPRNEPISVPNTTTASAPSSAKASLPWCLGSRRAIIGARKMPAATNDVATQKSASWTCQVRIRLYGKTTARSKPKKLSISAR